MVLLLYYSFKRQNMAGACAEAGAEIMEKGGAGVGAENKQFRLCNTVFMQLLIKMFVIHREEIKKKIIYVWIGFLGKTKVVPGLMGYFVLRACTVSGINFRLYE